MCSDSVGHAVRLGPGALRWLYCFGLRLSKSSFLAASSSSADGTFERASFAAAATSGFGSLTNRSYAAFNAKMRVGGPSSTLLLMYLTRSAGPRLFRKFPYVVT